MLSVFLTRTFVMDLVEHMARMRAPDTAVALAPDLRRRFGIGNSTGLGMAPFVVNHPALLNNWVAARETALARVRSLPRATAEEAAQLRRLIARAQDHARHWTSAHPVQQRKLADLTADLAALAAHAKGADLTRDYPWNRLWLWAEGALSLEGQEQLASLLMEPYGALFDDLGARMCADEQNGWCIDGAMPLAALRAIVEDVYGWALAIDWAARDAQARVWYTSAEKLEPRLGERFEEPIEPYEQPLCPGRDAARLHADLAVAGDGDVAGLSAVAPAAPPYRAPRPGGGETPLCRDPRQHD